jgi:hypothetical protein
MLSANASNSEAQLNKATDALKARLGLMRALKAKGINAGGET